MASPRLAEITPNFHRRLIRMEKEGIFCPLMRVRCSLLIAMLFFFTAISHAATPPPKVRGEAVIVVDAKSGRVLFHRNSRAPRAVASTQKLLTALIIAETGNLDAIVTIQPSDTAVAPTKLYLKAGQKYSRRDLLQVLLVKSANDVACALARDNAGSVAAFADKMNTRAQAMGATASHFINPNGLPAEGQFSTARDMAIIARNVYANPLLREIVATKSLDFHFADGRTREMINTNRVLRTAPFCNGMKTGYTDAAGHCLVASGQHDERDVISVILGSNKANIWKDSQELLEWGLGL